MDKSTLETFDFDKAVVTWSQLKNRRIIQGECLI